MKKWFIPIALELVYLLDKDYFKTYWHRYSDYMNGISIPPCGYAGCYTLEIPPFNFKVHIVFKSKASSISNVIEACQDLFQSFPEDVQEAFYAALEEGKENFVVHQKTYCILYLGTSEEDTKEIISHEIVHIINCLFLGVGIIPERDNDELQAYLTSWLYREITELQELALNDLN